MNCCRKSLGHRMIHLKWSANIFFPIVLNFLALNLRMKCLAFDWYDGLVITSLQLFPKTVSCIPLRWLTGAQKFCVLFYPLLENNWLNGLTHMIWLFQHFLLCLLSFSYSVSNLCPFVYDVLLWKGLVFRVVMFTTFHDLAINLHLTFTYYIVGQ